MKTLLSGLVLCFVLLASPSAAQVAGPWHVTGSVSGHDFALDCQFTDGTTPGGVCVETKTGKRHVLTKFSASGTQVMWSYKASYMMYNFDIDYAGTLTGNNMAGTVTASGHDGNFTATRQ